MRRGPGPCPAVACGPPAHPPHGRGGAEAETGGRQGQGVGPWPVLQGTALEMWPARLEVAWSCSVCLRPAQQSSVFLFQLPHPAAVQKAVKEGGERSCGWSCSGAVCWWAAPLSLACPTQMLPWLSHSPLSSSLRCAVWAQSLVGEQLCD